MTIKTVAPIGSTFSVSNKIRPYIFLILVYFPYLNNYFLKYKILYKQNFAILSLTNYLFKASTSRNSIISPSNFSILRLWSSKQKCFYSVQTIINTV